MPVVTTRGRGILLSGLVAQGMVIVASGGLRLVQSSFPFCEQPRLQDLGPAIFTCISTTDTTAVINSMSTLTQFGFPRDRPSASSSQRFAGFWHALTRASSSSGVQAISDLDMSCIVRTVSILEHQFNPAKGWVTSFSQYFHAMCELTNKVAVEAG